MERILFLQPRSKGVPRIFHWGQDQSAEDRQQGWGSCGAAPTPSPPARRSGERCDLSSGVQGEAPTAQRFSAIFSTQDGRSRHYNIVNCGLSCSRWGRGPRPHTLLAYFSAQEPARGSNTKYITETVRVWLIAQSGLLTYLLTSRD